jgi:hypothetical protein
MTSQEYINGVLRTESRRFDATHVNGGVLWKVFGAYIEMGKAVDALKRALYYGKPLNTETLAAHLEGAARYLDGREEPAPLPGYSDKPSLSDRIIHAVMGIAGEGAELLEAVLDCFQRGEDFDYANFFEELGDISWYQAVGIDAGATDDLNRQWTHEAIWKANLAKLRARYPDKFATTNAYDRNLAAEKKALEDNAQ